MCAIGYLDRRTPLPRACLNGGTQRGQGALPVGCLGCHEQQLPAKSRDRWVESMHYSLLRCLKRVKIC